MRGRGAGEGERDGRGDVTEEEELAHSCSFPLVRHIVPYALSCRGLCREPRFTIDVNVAFFPHESAEFSSFRGGGKDPHVTIFHVVMSDASAGWQRRHDVATRKTTRTPQAEAANSSMPASGSKERKGTLEWPA